MLCQMVESLSYMVDICEKSCPKKQSSLLSQSMLQVRRRAVTAPYRPSRWAIQGQPRTNSMLNLHHLCCIGDCSNQQNDLWFRPAEQTSCTTAGSTLLSLLSSHSGKAMLMRMACCPSGCPYFS